MRFQAEGGRVDSNLTQPNKKALVPCYISTAPKPLQTY